MRYKETAKQMYRRKQREYRFAIYRTIGQWVVVAIQCVIMYKVFLR